MLPRCGGVMRVEPFHLGQPAEGVADVRQVDAAAAVVVGEVAQLSPISGSLNHREGRIR